jgi:hypothetical protein
MKTKTLLLAPFPCPMTILSSLAPKPRASQSVIADPVINTTIATGVSLKAINVGAPNVQIETLLIITAHTHPISREVSCCSIEGLRA